MPRNPIPLALITLLSVFALNGQSYSQVKDSAADGFLIEISRTVNLDRSTVYQSFIEDFSKWYDASHSYSGKPENLSLDLGKHCMLEKLPEGGFVRHMEIVFHQPGKLFRMTGGLGPLQGMGVSGSLTFAFAESDGNTTITMTYAVSGSQFMKLDQISGPVNQVLGIQMDRLKKHCDQLATLGKRKTAGES